MHTLEIRLQRSVEGRSPVVVERSVGGGALPMRSEGELTLSLEELQAAQLDRKAYGELLGKSLFRDDVRDAFVQARSEGQETLRVLLDVEDEALRRLRWERLCAPFDGKWDFLALNQRAPLSLYLPSLTDRRFPAIGRRDLKALVVVASPSGLDQYGLSPFDASKAVHSVRTALGEIPSDLLAEEEGAVGQATLDTLCERITAQPYSLLHLVCHGKFQSESGDTVLYLARSDGSVEPVTTTRLIDRLSKLQGARGLPHFAFLCTCESAAAEAEGALGGLGQRLVRELGMPAVVAMTEKISVATAGALASAFYQQLRQHGEVDRALVEATAGLQGRYDVTVPALFSRLGGRPLFSDTLDRELTQQEIKSGLVDFEALLSERAPILRSRFEAIANTLQSTLSSAPQALSKESGKDRKQALAELEHLCEEVTDLSFAALAQGQEPPAYDSRCPFRGLFPFKAEDREFFCGREQLIKRLAEKVIEHPLLAVLGPSGSGKSSVVMAGLIPALQAKQPELSIGYLTPTADPLGQLEAALTKLASPSGLLIVDQFEELFTLCSDQAKRKRFIDQLLELPSQKIWVVITMRADFWGECASYPKLKDAMLAHQELIGPMDTLELRRGMEEQARKVGLRFEADLSNTILDDVRDEPGAMPLLQHALLELWKRRHGRWLRAEEYRAIGGDEGKASGVRGAIARTADDVYQQLSKAEQDKVRDIFVRLTRLDEGAVQGAEQRDTRRRAKLEELVPAGDAGEATKLLVNRLADAKLVVTSRNAVSGSNEVEVAHEALIRYWPRLRTWLDEDRVAVRLREGISEAAVEWHNHPKDKDLLLHKGTRLDEIEKLLIPGRLTLNDLERNYITACQVHRRVQERSKKSVIAGLTMLTVIAVAFAGLGWWQKGKAEEQAKEARAGELVAAAENLVKDQPDQSLLLGLAARRISPIARADAFLRAARASYSYRIVLRGHDKRVARAQFSADGKTVVTASYDKTARLWDVASGKAVQVLRGHEGPVRSAQFFADGKRVVTASADKTARMWDVASGKELQVLRGHEGSVVSAQISADGKTVVTASEDGTARLWDSSGKELQVLRGHEDGVKSVQFSADGKTVVTVSADGTARLWKCEVCRPVEEIAADLAKTVGRDLTDEERRRFGVPSSVR